MNSKPKSAIHKRQSSKARNPTANRMRFPDRWLQYVPVGKDIPGLRIVAFKTPLHSQYFTGMADDDETRFEVSTVLSYASQAGKTLGLVVDLTNTDKYYNAQDWLDNSVEYHKLKCRGHEVNKQEEIVQNFITTILEFLSKNVNNDKVVGVHCTHGLNRTGYLICRYMIDCLGVSAAEAIEKFEMNRGHTIERHHYIASLYESEARAKALGILPPTMQVPLIDNKAEENPAASESLTRNPAEQESVPQCPAIAEYLPGNPTQNQPVPEDITPAINNS
uniref:RNA/RNP complex-1-interacting phosphatase n=1 Tax=Ditylenchus dipsaci TaxID=166011 RepID=A0A915DT21_9BILA